MRFGPSKIGLRDALAWWLWCPTALRVKDKILAIDPPHELCAILNSLFELLLRVAAPRSLRRASDEQCSRCGN